MPEVGRSWYFDHGPMVHRRCLALLDDEAEALEALQEVFAEASRGSPPAGASSPTTVLYRAATRACLRRRAARPRDSASRTAALFDRLAREPALEGRALGAWVVEAFVGVAAVSTRELAVLHLVDGLSAEEVAEVVGTSASVVRARLARRAPAGGAAPRPIPDLFVERTFAGEASDAERARLQADPDARTRLADLLRQNASFHMRHDGDALLAGIEARAGAPADGLTAATPPANWWPVVLVGAPVALAAALLLWMPQPVTPADPPPTEQAAKKRVSSRLRVSQETPRGVERVSTDEVLFAGDEIRVFTVAGSARHGVVVSIDGRGAVATLSPAGGRDTALPTGQQPVGEPFALGDAPDFERFVLVTGEAAIDVDAVVAAARTVAAGPDARRAPLPLPRGLEQTSFVIRKGER